MYRFDIFSKQIDIYTIKTRKDTKIKKSVDDKCDYSQGIQKITKEWEEPGFIKTLWLAYHKFGFLNFVDTNIENFSVINFAISVTEIPWMHGDVFFGYWCSSIGVIV